MLSQSHQVTPSAPQTLPVQYRRSEQWASPPHPISGVAWIVGRPGEHQQKQWPVHKTAAHAGVHAPRISGTRDLALSVLGSKRNANSTVKRRANPSYDPVPVRKHGPKPPNRRCRFRLRQVRVRTPRSRWGEGRCQNAVACSFDRLFTCVATCQG